MSEVEPQEPDDTCVWSPANRPNFPFTLTWDEVDPARHPFDLVTVPDVVRAVAAAVAVPDPCPRSAYSYPEGDGWANAMSFALADRYGRLACGWRYSLGESDLGCGPVHTWCCPSHSIGHPEETLALVADALVEWRHYLEDMAERFGRFVPLITDPNQSRDVVVDAWERAVAHLINVVADRTDSDIGWWVHCKQVLGWFLTAAGVPADRHGRLIDAAIDKRFDRWHAPSNRLVAEAAELFAAQVTGATR